MPPSTVASILSIVLYNCENSGISNWILVCSLRSLAILSTNASVKVPLLSVMPAYISLDNLAISFLISFCAKTSFNGSNNDDAMLSPDTCVNIPSIAVLTESPITPLLSLICLRYDDILFNASKSLINSSNFDKSSLTDTSKVCIKSFNPCNPFSPA